MTCCVGIVVLGHANAKPKKAQKCKSPQSRRQKGATAAAAHNNHSIPKRESLLRVWCPFVQEILHVVAFFWLPRAQQQQQCRRRSRFRFSATLLLPPLLRAAAGHARGNLHRFLLKWCQNVPGFVDKTECLSVVVVFLAAAAKQLVGSKSSNQPAHDSEATGESHPLTRDCGALKKKMTCACVCCGVVSC